MFCVDASVIIAAILPHEPAHKESRIFIEKLETQKGAMICPALTLVEIAATLSRIGAQEEEILNLINELKQLSGLRFISLDTRFIESAIKTAIRFKIRAADAFYIALAIQYRLPLVTLDKEILKIGRRSLVFKAIRPEERNIFP